MLIRKFNCDNFGLFNSNALELKLFLFIALPYAKNKYMK